MRKQIVQNILVDEGISFEVQEHYTDEELYAFAEDICNKRDEVLEDIILLEEVS